MDPAGAVAAHIVPEVFFRGYSLRNVQEGDLLGQGLGRQQVPKPPPGTPAAVNHPPLCGEELGAGAEVTLFGMNAVIVHENIPGKLHGAAPFSTGDVQKGIVEMLFAQFAGRGTQIRRLQGNGLNGLDTLVLQGVVPLLVHPGGILCIVGPAEEENIPPQNFPEQGLLPVFAAAQGSDVEENIHFRSGLAHALDQTGNPGPVLAGVGHKSAEDIVTGDLDSGFRCAAGLHYQHQPGGGDVVKIDGGVQKNLAFPEILRQAQGEIELEVAAAPDLLVDIVNKWNPSLMIVTDDVYATYVPGFQSLMARLPHNTICVYSFSKYFGATGWRSAVIAMHRDNIFDKLIERLPRKRKTELKQRYGSIRSDVENMRFIDRMVADSRHVALNHTAGLSLPQQMQMTLFALYSIIDKREGDNFRLKMHEIIQERLNALWTSMGFTLIPDPLRAGYYSEIDLLVWAQRFYGKDFVEWLRVNYNPLDVVFRLARETSLVVLNGGGFDGPEWSIRVSLANLNTKDYTIIGKSVRAILDSYATRWKKSIPMVENNL